MEKASCDSSNLNVPSSSQHLFERAPSQLRQSRGGRGPAGSLTVSANLKRATTTEEAAARRIGSLATAGGAPEVAEGRSCASIGVPAPLSVRKVPSDSFQPPASLGSEDQACGTVRPGSPSVPKIPNFARALSGSSSSIGGSSLSGSLSARDAERSASFRAAPTAGSLEARRPLTARPASLGVTTPRGTAMLGPRPGDRSMRGMDGLLAASALVTPRPDPSALGSGGTVVTPRSPRGVGVRSARRGGDECVMAPRSPRGGRGQRGGGGGNEWLRAAVDVARGGERGGGGWLQEAVGALVGLRTEAVAAAGVAAAHAAAARSEGGTVIGTLESEVSGAAGMRWHVRLASGAPAIIVASAALRKVAPRRGDFARCVLGESSGVCGEVLSVENGVAVMRATAPSAGQATPAGPASGGVPEASRKVRVLPLDALTRLETSPLISVS